MAVAGAMLAAVLLLRPLAPPPAAGAEEAAAATQFSEEQIKAAMLVAFARTTEWPQGTFGPGVKAFRIGIVGRDTLGEKATSISPASGAGKMTFRFQVVTDDADARQCHILFIPRTEKRRGRELMDGIKNLPVLTVGESDDFLDQNGMVNLVPRSGVMKYEINLNPTKAAGLRIPSKVLGPALKVIGKYE